MKNILEKETKKVMVLLNQRPAYCIFGEELENIVVCVLNKIMVLKFKALDKKLN